MDFLLKDPEALSGLDREMLLSYRSQVTEQIGRLDEREPEDQMCEAYEDWADAHEELEDLLDDIDDRLDELN